MAGRGDRKRIGLSRTKGSTADQPVRIGCVTEGNSGAGVGLSSNGLIQGGNVTADGNINGFTDATMDLGDLVSGGYIELLALGDLQIGNAIAAERDFIRKNGLQCGRSRMTAETRTA